MKDFIWDIEKLNSPLDDILKDEATIKDARENLRALQVHPGWTILLRMIDYNAKIVQNKLNTTEDFTIDQMKDLQRRRAALVKLALLPEQLINKLTMDASVEEEDDDPFES